MADSIPMPANHTLKQEAGENRMQDTVALFRQELLLSVRDYSVKASSVSDREWLAAYFAKRLPQWSPETCRRRDLGWHGRA